VIETVISTYLLDGDFEREIERVGNLVFFVLLGVIGNGLYLRRARIAVAKVRAQLPEGGPGRLALLRNMGGTTWAPVVIGLVAFIILAIVAASIPD
jgi:hypothetical protein